MPQIANRGVITGTNFSSVSTNTVNTPIVSNNANLSALAVSSGTLSPAFASSVTAYSVLAANSVSTISITPRTEHPGATVSVNSTTVSSGSAISVSLAVCANTIPISVTAEDGTTTKSYTLTVTRAAPPVTLVASSPISCTAPVITLTATAGFASYSFGNGAGQLGVPNTATVNGAGMYSVTATDVSGCSSTTSISVSGSSIPTQVSLTASNGGAITCSAPNVTLTGTPGFVSYSFSSGTTPGSTTNTAVVSTSGVYSLTATDTNVCTTTASGAVTGTSVGQPVDLTASGVISCTAPVVTLTATSGFSSYLFSSGATQGTPTNTALVTLAGTYSGSATDANYCVSSASATITGSSTPIPVSLSVSNPITCLAPLATLSATSRYLSYSFSSNATQGSPTNTATVSVSGVYSVTATDVNLCPSTASTTVTGTSIGQPINLTASGPITCPTPIITLTATSGFVSYTFSSGQIAATNTATVSAAGTYSVAATDLNSCRSTTVITVTGSSAPISVSLSANGVVTCANPVVTLTATQLPNTTYVFSTSTSQPGGPMSNTATVTNGGVYSVVATNANSCTATASVSVSGVVPVNVSLVVSGTLTCAVASVTLTATAGLSSYTFSSPAVQQGGATGNTALVSIGGLYTVRAMDGNGCLSTASGFVVQEVPPSASSFTSSGPLGLGNCRVKLSAVATGNAFVFTGPGGYVFSNVYRAGGTYSVFGLDVKLPGTYTLTIYSGPGCAPVSYTTQVTGTACP